MGELLFDETFNWLYDLEISQYIRCKMALEVPIALSFPLTVLSDILVGYVMVAEEKMQNVSE
jgi:hypothetical protein